MIPAVLPGYLMLQRVVLNSGLGGTYVKSMAFNEYWELGDKIDKAYTRGVMLYYILFS